MKTVKSLPAVLFECMQYVKPGHISNDEDKTKYQITADGAASSCRKAGALGNSSIVEQT